MSEQNKQIVRSIEEAWDSGRLDELDRYFAPGFRSHSALPDLPPGLEGAKMAHQMSIRAFPDRRAEIQDMVAEGDRVVVRVRTTGTNTGGAPWMGLEPNGKPFDIHWISIYRLEDGRAVEHWAVNEELKLLIQLGVLPAPGARAPA